MFDVCLDDVFESILLLFYTCSRLIMTLFIILYLTIVDITNGGNCAGGICRSKKPRVPAISEEESDLLLFLSDGFVLNRTSQTTHKPTDNYFIRTQSTSSSAGGSSAEAATVGEEKFSLSAGEVHSAFALPPIGVYNEFISPRVIIHMMNDTRFINYSLSSGGEGIGLLSIVSDCREDHLVNKLLQSANVLSHSGISEPPLLSFGDTCTGFDPLFECERSRRAIVWKVLPGFMSLTDFRRNHPDRVVPIRKTFEIGVMILDMVWKMLKVGVVHGSLTPRTVLIGKGRLIISGLEKASFVPVGSDMPDMRSVFQIIVDMNPRLYRIYDHLGVEARRFEYIKLLNELRTILMDPGDLEGVYSEAMRIMGLLVSIL